MEDSFVGGLLDCPHYTRPEVYEGEAVPEALMSGDHKNSSLAHQAVAGADLEAPAGFAWRTAV